MAEQSQNFHMSKSTASTGTHWFDLDLKVTFYQSRVLVFSLVSKSFNSAPSFMAHNAAVWFCGVLRSWGPPETILTDLTNTNNRQLFCLRLSSHNNQLGKQDLRFCNSGAQMFVLTGWNGAQVLTNLSRMFTALSGEQLWTQNTKPGAGLKRSDYKEVQAESGNWCHSTPLRHADVS